MDSHTNRWLPEGWVADLNIRIIRLVRSSSWRHQAHVIAVSPEGEETDLGLVEPGGCCGSGLREAFDQEFEGGRIWIVLDLVDVSKIDSCGVAEIVAGFQRARAPGGEIVLANVNDETRRVFRICNLDSVILIFDSVREALEYLMDRIRELGPELTKNHGDSEVSDEDPGKRRPSWLARSVSMVARRKYKAEP